jgi:hypothetical protein
MADFPLIDGETRVWRKPGRQFGLALFEMVNLSKKVEEMVFLVVSS